MVARSALSCLRFATAATAFNAASLGRPSPAGPGGVVGNWSSGNRRVSKRTGLAPRK